MTNREELLTEKVELLSNALALRIYWTLWVKKILLLDWKMKENQVDEYIKVLEIFTRNTMEALEGQFKFLKD